MIFPDRFLKILTNIKVLKTSYESYGKETSYGQDGFENEIRTYVLFLVFVP